MEVQVVVPPLQLATLSSQVGEEVMLVYLMKLVAGELLGRMVQAYKGKTMLTTLTVAQETTGVVEREAPWKDRMVLQTRSVVAVVRRARVGKLAMEGYQAAVVEQVTTTWEELVLQANAP